MLAQLGYPEGIACDSNGNVFLVDGRIRKITPDGLVRTIAGSVESKAINRSGDVAEFLGARDVAVDGNGFLVIAEGGDGRARRGRPLDEAVSVVLPSAIWTTPGTEITLRATSTVGPSVYEWSRNGYGYSGNEPVIRLQNFGPRLAGLYAATAAGQTTARQHRSAIVGVRSESKTVGDASEIGPDILHGNGTYYDQVLLQGTAASITADAAQVTRMSYVDLTGDIVQVEFSGAGTLTLVSDMMSEPAPPANYNQTSVEYVKGHAGIVITGADETTNVTVFSVGRLTAGNQALFKAEVNYNGFADLAFIAIESGNGKFGGIRAANVNFYATRGLTGIYAPNLEVLGPLYVGEITASDAATPVLLLGGAMGDTWITGGDLLQLNNQPVKISGIGRLEFKPGTNSHGAALSAQANQGRLEHEGVDVTAAIAVNPQGAE